MGIKIIVCGDFRATNPSKIKIDDDVAEIIKSAFQCESHRWVIERYLRNKNKQ